MPICVNGCQVGHNRVEETKVVGSNKVSGEEPTKKGESDPGKWTAVFYGIDLHP